MYGIYYNQLFDALMVTKKSQTPQLVNVKDNIVLLTDKNNEINGVNIFNVSQDLHPIKAFNSFEPEVLAYVKTKLADQFLFTQSSQFVVGRVLVCEDIEGTHLHLCEVDLGDRVEQIVCGAANVAIDQLVVVALNGAWMPNGEQIVPSKLRGYESNGMICSQKELALENDDFNQTGIIVLPPMFANRVGQDFFKESEA